MVSLADRPPRDIGSDLISRMALEIEFNPPVIARPNHAFRLLLPSLAFGNH